MIGQDAKPAMRTDRFPRRAEGLEVIEPGLPIWGCQVQDFLRDRKFEGAELIIDKRCYFVPAGM